MMTYEETCKVYAQIEDHTDEFGKFKRVNKRYEFEFPIRSQIHIIMLLGELFPNKPKVIREVKYGNIILGDISDMIDVLTPELILEFIRCGVSLIGSSLILDLE